MEVPRGGRSWHGVLCALIFVSFSLHISQVSGSSCASTTCLSGGTCSVVNSVETCSCVRGLDGDVCEKGTCTTKDSQISTLASSGDYRLALFRDQKFTCTTKIIAIEYYAMNTGTFYVGFWNAGSPASGYSYTLKAKISITASSTGSNTYTIPAADRPTVYTNYIISVHYGSASSTVVVPYASSSDGSFNNYGLAYADLGQTYITASYDSSLSIDTTVSWAAAAEEPKRFSLALKTYGITDDCLSSPCANGGTCGIAAAGWSCTCTSDYVGTSCSVANPCLSNPCQNSGTCAVDGTSFTCTCAAGYTGTTCSDVIACLSNPCQHTSTCTAEAGNALNYACACEAGTTGTSCENYVVCLSNPCQQGGTCAPDPGEASHYACTCAAGTTGTHCENYVVCLSNPCQNDATCAPHPDNSANYQCTCAAGTTGTHCENYVVCLSNPCQNDATCAPHPDNSAHYQCTCAAGTTGTHCENYVVCLSNPCENAATCAPDPGEASNYACTCAEGTTGTHCENYVVCLSNPCENAATCAPDPGEASHYACTCAEGTTGTHCENYVVCLSNPCENAATCAPDPGEASNYACTCAEGTTGTHCENYVVCLSNPCENAATCAPDPGEASHYACTCAEGTTGTHCENYVVCLSNPCENGATCSPHPSESSHYQCTCVEGTTGTHCENYVVCLSNPCQMGGTCGPHPSESDYHLCTCTNGTTGLDCESYSVCLSNPCENDATCSPNVHDSDHYSCTCTAIKTGTNCESHITCLSNPCQNDGTCLPDVEGGAGYYCACAEGKTGTHCESHTVCLSNPCRSGDTCYGDSADSYLCLSTSCRYEESGITYHGTQSTTVTGRTCQAWDSQTPHSHSATDPLTFHVLNVSEASNYCRNPTGQAGGPWCYGADADNPNGTSDVCDIPGCALECGSDPCQNGATCVPRYIEGYNCTCPPNYHGIHCTNPCDSNPCQLNGTCLVDTDTGLNYTCSCAEGTTGTHCENWIVCLSDPCENYGTCGVTELDVHQFECTCMVGKNGTQCEHHQMCLSNPCQWGGTCLPHPDGGEPYICDCPPGKTGVHCENHIPCLSNPCRDGDTCWGDNWDTYICLSSWCRWSERGESYYGTLNTTASNGTCQRWDSTTPNDHSYGVATNFYELTVSEANNYCRNPGFSRDAPWCYLNDTDSGLTWDYCEMPGCSLDCESDPCQNYGTCVPRYVEGYNCTCGPDYYGIHCTNPCDSNPCMYNATCNPNTETGLDYYCTCTEGRTGVHCEDWVVCLSDPCENAGTCGVTEESVYDFECTCVIGKNGTQCEIHYTCLSNPCQWGGTCVPHPDGGEPYFCICPPGKTGDQCEYHIPCLSNPCRDGDTCWGDNWDTYICLSSWCRWSERGESYYGMLNTTRNNHTCQRWDDQVPNSHPFANETFFYELVLADTNNYCRNPNFNDTGPWCYVNDTDTVSMDYCEIPGCSLDCQSWPCQNGGTCIPGWVDGYNCTCPELYYGLHCTNPCDSNPCQNGGTCNPNTETGLDYYCDCMEGKTGVHCEYHIVCLSNPCRDGDTCHGDAPHTYICLSSFCRWTELGHSYYGTHANTLSGKTCQRWDEQTPHSHSIEQNGYYFELNITDMNNYCRNPDNTTGIGPWCYTTDPNLAWETCDIRGCSLDCDSSPCLNGGTCVPGYVEGYYCKCVESYYEYHCEKRAVITNNTNEYAFQTSSFSVLGYTSVIVEANLYNTDAGSCSEMHTSVRVLSSDGQAGYEFYIGASYNANCRVLILSGTNAATKTDVVSQSCSPLKCNEPREYWVAWDDWVIRSGSGRVVGENQFVTYYHQNYVEQLSTLGFASHTGHKAHWRLLGACNEHCLSCFFDENLNSICTQCEVLYELMPDFTCQAMYPTGDFYLRYRQDSKKCIKSEITSTSVYRVDASVSTTDCTPYRIVSGTVLGASNDTVLLQATEWPGYYLRHTSYFYYLDRAATHGGVQNDGIFYAHNDTTNPNYLYFETATTGLAGYYLKDDGSNRMKLIQGSSDIQNYMYYTTDIIYKRTKSSGTMEVIMSDVTDSVAFGFMVKAASTVEMYLTDGTSSENLYRFSIGAASNSRLYLRTSVGGSVVNEYSGTFLDSNMFKYFWVSWKDGIIKMGTGRNVDSNIGLNYRHNGPYNVVSVKVGGNYGEWYILGTCSRRCSGCSFDNSTFTEALAVCHECQAGYMVNQDRTKECVEYRRLGCFAMGDESGGDMSAERTTMSSLTPARCAEMCYQGNYSYAATSEGNKCGCGDYFATHGQYIDSKCQSACVGDSSQYCGGSYANAIYALAPVRYLFKTDTSTTEIDTGLNVTANHTLFLYDYMGCQHSKVFLRDASGSDSNAYAVYLGQSSNFRVNRIRHDTGTTRREVTQTTISCTEFKPFWIAWKDGRIRVGKNHRAFDDKFMDWTDSSPQEPVKLTIASSTYSGFWELLGTCPEHCASCFINSMNITLCSRCDANYFLYNNTCLEFRHLGCFLDAENRDLAYHYDMPHTMTREKCSASCYHAGYHWAGIQVGSQCFCGNRYNTYGERSASECSTMCTGDSSTRCGASWRNNIMELYPSYKCYSEPCMNGGSCINDYVWENYTCACSYEWVGIHCEHPNPCLSDPCVNGGTCEPQIDGTFVCNCVYSFIGYQCEFSNPCLSNPCLNEGTCNDNWNTGFYMCSCFPDQAGLLCEIDAVTGSWSKITNSNENRWTSCTSLGCEGSPNVTYCQNLARHEDGHGSNLIFYSSTLKHCCKFYCADWSNKQLTSSSSAMNGHEGWFYAEKTASNQLDVVNTGHYTNCENTHNHHANSVDHCKYIATTQRVNHVYYRTSDRYCSHRRCYTTDSSLHSSSAWTTYSIAEEELEVVYIPFNRTYSNAMIGYPYDGGFNMGSVSITSDSYRQYAHFDGNAALNFGRVQHLCWGNLDLCPNGWTMSYWMKFLGNDINSGTEQFYIHSGAWTGSGWGFGMKGRLGTVTFRFAVPSRYWGDVSFSAPSNNVWHHYGITWGWWNGLTVYVDGVKKGNDWSYTAYSFSNSYPNWYFGRLSWSTDTAYNPYFGIDDFLVINEEKNKYGVWELYSTTHHASVCDLNPCQNGASCQQDPVILTEHCHCTWDHIGQFCEFWNPCVSNPCQNGATCEPDPETGTYNCSCPYTHIGIHCEHYDPCLSEPCMEGGTCVSHIATGYFTCLCLETRVGIQCEFPHPCLSSPCQNYGTCAVHYNYGTFHCECIYDSLGRLCEYDSTEEQWHVTSSNHHVTTCSHPASLTLPLDECKNQTIYYKCDMLNHRASDNLCQVRRCTDGDTRLVSGYSGWTVHRREIQDMTRHFVRQHSTGEGGHTTCEHLGQWVGYNVERCKYLTKTHYGNAFNWRSNDCNAKRCYSTSLSMYFNGDGWDVYSLAHGEHMIYIPMNQTSGSSVYIYGTYPETGTTANGPYVHKDGRNGMLFNGVNQYVNFGYVRHLCLGQLDHCTALGLTVAFWVKPRGSHGDNHYVISTGAHASTGAGISFRTYASNMDVWVAKSSYRYHCAASLYNGYNSWYHVAATWTNDLGLTVYLDGKKRCDDTSADHYSQTWDYTSLTVGRPNNADCCYAAMTLSDVVFFDRWKTRWDIWDMYSSTSHFNVCTTNPCQNGGSCIQHENNTLEFCDCPRGWIGLFCEVADPCISDPCQNGATCNHDLEREYFNCTCTWDYIGDLCQFLDPCLSNPCMSGGTCNKFPSDGHFFCNCVVDHVGLQCEVPTASNHLDLAIVMDGSRNVGNTELNKIKTFSSALLNRVTVDQSHTRVAMSVMRDSCGADSRLNSYGSRSAAQGGINGVSYHDQYRDIWCSLHILKEDIFHTSYGDRTTHRDVVLMLIAGGSQTEETRVAAQAELLRTSGIFINIIAIGSQSNQTFKQEMATIANPPAANHVFNTTNYDELNSNEFLPEIVLASLYTLPDDVCLSNPCMHGSSCMRGNWTETDSTYTCLCPDDYFGLHCEWLRPCLSVPCQMDGTCEEEPVNGTYYCHCTYNYNVSLFERIGVNCEYDNPCLSYPCQMGGSCLDQRDTGFFICECTWDRIGVVCEYDNPCLSDPCQRNGTCEALPNNGTYLCECTWDRIGLDCEHDDPCLSDPCQHGASCVNYLDGTYTCTCTWDYIGTHCEYYDPCISQPCQHAATCVNQPDDGTYVCNCTWDYIGVHCQHYDPCISLPCQAGATCHNEPVNGTYDCECTYDRIGVHCEYDNPCLSDPCQVEGTCLHHYWDGTYHCACRSDRIGPYCEFDIRDPCQGYPCLNGGSCSSQEPYKYFSCACPTFTTSEYCENFMCQDINILNFTKITNNMGRAMHIFLDMPFTCKGEVVGLILNSNTPGSFYFDVWEQMGASAYKLLMKKKITTTGSPREQVDFAAEDYIATKSNYFWGIHYENSRSTTVLRGFDSRQTEAIAGTPWNIDTMSSIILSSKYNSDLRVNRVTTFASTDIKSYKRIPAVQPLVAMDVGECVRVSLPDTYNTEETAWTIGLRDDVELEASIIKKCPIGNLSIIFTWYRKSLTRGDYFYQLVDKQYYRSGGAVIKMPAREFEPGLWRIKASIDSIPTSDQIFARVIQSDLVGLITGGTSKTVMMGKTVTVDAKTKSSDPDADGDMGLLFSWSCFNGEVFAADEITFEFNRTDCAPELGFVFDFTGGILSVDTGTVPEGLYTFRVRVYKDVRQAFYDQSLNIVDGFVPEMSIGCLINCGNRVVPTMKLSLVLACEVCFSLDEMVFKWELFLREGGEFVEQNLEELSAAGTSGEGVVVKPNVFTPGKYYRLRLNMNCASCAASYTEYSFMVNLPPEPGSCAVSPSEGQSLVTEFIVTCEGWISGGSSDPEIDPVPLSYQFFTLNDDGSRSLIYFGSTANMPPMPLGLGPANNNFNRTIIVVVSDIFGSSTEMRVFVRVTAPDLSGGDGGSASDVMTGALGMISDNPKQAAQVIASIGSVLNSGSGDSGESGDGGGGGLSKEEASEIRKSMINTISSMASSVEKTDDVIQLTEALGSSTGNPDEVDDSALSAASGTLLTMTGSASSMLTSKPEDAERVAKSLMDTSMNVLAAGSAPPATVTIDDGTGDEDAAMSAEELAAIAAANAEADAAAAAELKAKTQGTTSTLASVSGMVGNAVLQTKAPGEDISTMENARGSMQVQKQKADALGGTSAGSSSSAITMPTNMQIVSPSSRKKRNVNSNSNIDFKLNTYTSNPYSWGSNTGGMAGVLNMTFQDENGNALDTEDDIDLDFANSATASDLEVNMTLLADPSHGLVYHKVSVGVANSSIILRLMPPEGALVFELFLKPVAKPTPSEHLYTTLVLGNETDNAVTDGVYVIIPGETITATGVYYIGLRPYDPDRWGEVKASSSDNQDYDYSDPSASSSSRRRRSLTGSSGNSTTNGTATNGTSYSIAITTTACRAWDNDVQDWVISGEVDPSGTTLTNTKCKGRPAATRSSFGCAFIAAPNTIDFANAFAQFANLGDNPAVFSVVISIVLAYFILLPFIIREDRKDQLRWKIDELDDNDPDDTYFYKITVETGLKRNAGTMSNIFFMLYGRFAESGKRRMVPKNRKGFGTGSTRWLIMRTYECLGKLEYMRIWHDNSGKDKQAGWFIDTITFEDMKKKVKGTFICKKDLSVTSDYGKTFAAFKAAERAEKAKFTYLMQRTIRNKFSDGHMWASIALIPYRSVFTRTQRLSVCIGALFLSMITSMMFYQTEDNVETPYQITLGPVKFTLNQLFVGFISALITVPPTMFIVQVYRGVNREDAQRDEVDLRMMMGHDYDSIVGKQKSAWNLGFGLYDDVSVSDMSCLEDSEEDSVIEEPAENYDANSVFSDWSQVAEEAEVKKEEKKDEEEPKTEEPKPEAEEEFVDVDLGDDAAPDTEDKKKKKKKKEKKVDSDGETIPDSEEGSEDEEEDEEEDEDEDDSEEGSSEGETETDWEESEEEEEVVEEEDEETRLKRENKRRKLSWCLLITAWVINILAILVPGFFCILYSMDWGAERANGWLISYMTSWAQSLFVTDPVKVLALGFVATIIVWRHALKAVEKTYKNDDRTFDMELPSEQLLNAEQLEAERKKLEARAMAKAALKEMLWHLVLCLLAISISFGAAGEEGHHLHDGIYDMFVKTFNSKVVSHTRYWWWLEEKFVPNYFVEKDINGNQLNWRERKYLVDRSSFRVGPARLRQLRMPYEPCPLSDMYRKCVLMYDRSSQDKSPYGPLKNVNFSDPTSYDPESPWLYQTSGQTKGLLYWGMRSSYGAGGYVSQMDINRDVSLAKLADLKRDLWIDRQTRAVILEFSVYNPNIDLFAFTSIVAEFGEQGGIVHHHQIQVLRAHTMGALSAYLYFCKAMLVIYLLVNLGFTIHAVVKKDGVAYFKDLKNLMDLFILVITFTAGVFYAMRTVTLNSVLATLKEENYKKYAPFARVATIDDSYKYCVAFLNAAVIFKLIVLLKLVKRIGALARTLRHSGSAIASFIFVFFIFICAFGFAMNVLYTSYMEIFAGVINTLWSMFSISLGSFDVVPMLQAHKTVTLIIFPLYMVTMNWVMFNMLITIIMDSHYEFKSLAVPDDERVLGEMVNAFWGNLNSASKLQTAVAPGGM